MVIKDLESLKRFLKTMKTPVFGVGVYAFHRLGLEDLVPNYKILALRYSLDTELIEKDVEILSLERGMGTQHIREPRNATTVLKSEVAKNYLKKFKRPVLIVYKTSSKMEKMCKENGWVLAQSPIKFGKNLFENKIKFRRILEEMRVTVPPGEIATLNLIEDSQENLLNICKEWRKKYGFPFVIQHPTRGGGKGTFFINSEEDFLKARKKLKIKTKEGEEIEENIDKIEVIVAKFVKGPSPSITGCVTRHGILSTNPQHQILDSPLLYNPKKGSGLFCGHDWSYSRFSENIKSQAYEITEKVGDYLKKCGYKGIFGLDFVLDQKEEKLCATECNPRFLGSCPTLTMIQLKNNEPPIVVFHLLEYLGVKYELDVKSINNLIRKNKEGAQMLMHNLSGRWTKNHKEIPAGIYRLESQTPKSPSSAVSLLRRTGKIPSLDSLASSSTSRSGLSMQGGQNPKLRFMRPGYKLEHIKNKDEFLITEGVPFRKSHFSPNRRLIRIITLKGVLKDYKTLNAWAINIVKTVYRNLDIKPVRFVNLRKLFDPYFLAKG